MKPNAFTLWRSPIFSTTNFESPFLRTNRRNTALPITYEHTSNLDMHIRAIPIWCNVQHEVVYLGSYFLPMHFVLAMRDFLLRQTRFIFMWTSFGCIAAILLEDHFGEMTKWAIYNVALVVPCVPLWMTLNVKIIQELMGYVGMWWMIFNYLMTSIALITFVDASGKIDSWPSWITLMVLRITAVIIWLPCYGLTDAFPEEFRRAANAPLFCCMAAFWIYWLTLRLMNFGQAKEIPVRIGDITLFEIVDLDTSCMFNLCVWSVRFMIYSYCRPDTFLILTSRINCEMSKRSHSINGNEYLDDFEGIGGRKSNWSTYATL